MTAVTAPPASPDLCVGDLRRPALLTVGAAAAALGLAVRAPVATAVLGLALVGLLHNVLELRYVLGRFEGVLAGRFLALLVALVTGVTVSRLLPVGAGPRSGEIVLGYTILGVAGFWAVSGQGPRAGTGARFRTGALVPGVVVLAAAAATSLTFPAYHFVVLAHLHNVVPLVFLWEWSAAAPPGPRRLFRASTFGWVAVVPAVLFLGVLDRWLRPGSVTLPGFGTFGASPLATLSTPPVWLHSAVATRFLTVFAFLQTMHYVVWVLLLPRYAPGATAAFERRVPEVSSRAVRPAVVACAAALAVVFAHDYATGRSVYAAVTTYHVYLEFPVLLALLLGAAGRGRSPAPGPTDKPTQTSNGTSNAKETHRAR